jgi:hypothetical protein
MRGCTKSPRGVQDGPRRPKSYRQKAALGMLHVGEGNTGSLNRLADSATHPDCRLTDAACFCLRQRKAHEVIVTPSNLCIEDRCLLVLDLFFYPS